MVGDSKVEILRNPTAGTLVDSGVAFLEVNRNFNTSRSLSKTLLKGSQGSTLTDGTVAIESIFSSVGRKTVSVGAIVLSKNNSVGIRVTPPAGNSDMDVQIAMSVYEEREEVTGA